MWLTWAAPLTWHKSAVLCTHTSPPDLKFLFLSNSDGVCDQVECRSRVLGRSGSHLLCRGGPGCHRRIPAGALARGPAHALSVNNSQHSWPASTWVFLPRHPDHRLGLCLWVDGGSCLCAFNICVITQLHYCPVAVWHSEQLVGAASVWVVLWRSHTKRGLQRPRCPSCLAQSAFRAVGECSFISALESQFQKEFYISLTCNWWSSNTCCNKVPPTGLQLYYIMCILNLVACQAPSYEYVLVQTNVGSRLLSSSSFFLAQFPKYGETTLASFFIFLKIIYCCRCFENMTYSY